jgi:hypothetical protein
MRSEFAEWLDQIQHIADAENIVVQARHIDLLEHFFKNKHLLPEQAFHDYKKFLIRWNAITENGKNTEALN